MTTFMKELQWGHWYYLSLDDVFSVPRLDVREVDTNRWRDGIQMPRWWSFQ